MKYARIISEKIPIFRMLTIFRVISCCSSILSVFKKPYGINTLLLSIVDNPIDETTIIEIAAENPTRKTKTVINWLSNNCGINNEYVSGFTDLPLNKILPPQATG